MQFTLPAQNMSHHLTIHLNLTVMSPINYFLYRAFTPSKQTLTHRHVRGHDHSLWFTHTLTIFFFSFTLQLMHSNEQYTHTYFSTTVQRSTTSRSTSRNLDKHIYSWFLSREGPTVNAGWQGRHISLSGKILHAFVWLYNSYCGSAHEHQGCRRQPVSLWNEVKNATETMSGDMWHIYVQVKSRSRASASRHALWIFFVIMTSNCADDSALRWDLYSCSVDYRHLSLSLSHGSHWNGHTRL